MDIRVSIFAPYLCNNPVSGLDEYADGCRITKEQINTLFFCVGALDGGFGRWVVRQRGPPQKVDMPF
jgi:hypothetical protein